MIFGIKNPLPDVISESWYLYVGLILAVSILIWVIIQIRTRLRDDTDHAADPWQLLKQMQDLHRGGELTEEEYRSIKSRLISQNDEFLQQPDDNSKQSIKEDCPDETSSDEQEARD